MAERKTPTPLPGPQPPAFSKRVWDGPVYGLDNLPTPVANTVATEGLTIYVEAIRSTYEEDWEGEVYAWRDQRSFLSRCSSVVEPEGEIGFTPLEDLSLEEWNRLISVNLTGTFLCIKHFGRIMLEQRSGSIVTITSTAASIPQSKSGAYSPSKAGATILARQAGMEWGEHGIRSNVVAPGAMWTPMTRPFQTDPEAVARRVQRIASRRIADPREISQVIAFLLSDLASYINGANIDVDGGLRQMMLSLMPRPGVNKI